MANDKDPKIVPGDDVNFADGNAQADTLEGRMEEKVGGVSPSWERENMQYLAEMVWPVLEVTYQTKIDHDGSRVFIESSKAPTPITLKDMLPSLVSTLKRQGQFKTLLKIEISRNIPSALLREIFEKCYGADLAQTGLYEVTGLDKDGPIQLNTLIPHFPEAASIKALEGRVFHQTDNPYLTTLCYPLHSRAFFAGALRELNLRVDNNRIIPQDTFVQPLTLKEVIAYARQVNEMAKVKDYMDILKQMENPK